MKLLNYPIVVLSFLSLNIVARADSAKHWYQVYLQEGDKQESVIGTSLLTPHDFAHSLVGLELVSLDDIRFSGGVDWAAPDNYLAKQQIFINPRFVIYFVEWAFDPLLKKQKSK